ncbi:MAG: hypothetical protein KDD36_07700 [Flavobacteriales bacterium]|nr:hypothetical protein [Flavobacteriales bacterium]
MSRTTSDHLYELIQALSHTEFSFIRRKLSSNRSSQSAHETLFNAMRSADENDEDLFKASVKNIAHYSRLKHYLYHETLNNLQDYHMESTVETQLQSLLHNIDILTERSLLDQATIQLRKAKKIALRYEKFMMLLNLIDIEKRMISNVINEEQLIKLEQEEQNTLDRIQEIIKYQNLSYRVFHIYRLTLSQTDNDGKRKTQELIERYLSDSNPTPQSFLAHRHRLHCTSIAYVALKDYERAFEFRASELALFEANDHMIGEYLRMYQVGLNNILELCNFLLKNEEFMVYTKKLRDILDHPGYHHTPFQKDHLFASIHENVLSWHVDRGEFDKAITHIEAMDIEAVERLPYPYQLKKRSIYFYMAMAYFGIRAYSEALKWVNQVLNQPGENLDSNILSSARLLNILIHLELNNMDLVDSEIRNYQYYLKKKKSPLKSELLLIQFIKLLNDASDLHELQEKFSSLQSQLDTLKDENDEAWFMHLSKLPVWLERRVVKNTHQSRS